MPIEERSESTGEPPPVEVCDERRVRTQRGLPSPPGGMSLADCPCDGRLIGGISDPRAASAPEQIGESPLRCQRQNRTAGAQIFIRLAGNLQHPAFCKQQQKI